MVSPSAHACSSPLRASSSMAPPLLVDGVLGMVPCNSRQPRASAGNKELNRPLLPSHFQLCEGLGGKVQVDSSRLEKSRPSFHSSKAPESASCLLFCASRQNRTNKLAPAC